ncbi:helix-turn-helix transcriptional regulator [Tsukamurella pseudospumae]|uniref:Transcriptional regulator n=1 Tax=Tsukamurella pseudospumae TaxID=239498 RepID=A0A137ZIY8_9ACTN|nr:transcriptional regulator [Tsukamurella pseudospumae]KXO98148.1 transcriptional regulator [Tsukamurella pseudospumae]KXP10738.1 transcriptional regulator [Tsukamurella pseudospumae]
MEYYLSLGEVAQHTGVSLSTMKTYLARGYLPEPDAIIGRNRGWRVETIDAWTQSRPGRGARTDQHNE